jgi:hypothetical protein
LQGASSSSPDLQEFSTPVIPPLPTPPCSPLPSDLRPHNIECPLCKRLFTNKQGLTKHRKTCVSLQQPQQPATEVRSASYGKEKGERERKADTGMTDLGIEDPGDPNLDTVMNAGSYGKGKNALVMEMTGSDTEDADDLRSDPIGAYLIDDQDLDPEDPHEDEHNPTEDISEDMHDQEHTEKPHDVNPDTKDADKPSLAKGMVKKANPPRAPQDAETPKTKMRNNLLPIARNLDSGIGDEGVAGEPGQSFVDRLAEILPRDAFLMDLGSSTGCFLYEMSKKRSDMSFSGVEADDVRFKLSQSLHFGLSTKLAHQNIMEMDILDDEVTCVFAHDTAWPINVVEKSTFLVLSSPNVQIVVCVKERPELVDCGRFVLSERIRFNLRGGKTERVASVYRATSVLTIAGLRKMVGEHARHFFLRDRDFYLGLTEKEKRADMEVRPSDCHLLAKL